MRVTQKDIARKLNLSQSLVTGVLNASPHIWASEETRRRVLEAARELNYQPHAAARALRSGKTHIVACVVVGSLGYDAVIERLADRLAEIEYDLLVKVMQNPEQAQARLQPLISGRICDAIVFWGEEAETEPLGTLAEQAKIPFAIKGHFEANRPNWVQVEFDHEGMMRQTVEHLASLGHRRIGYLGYTNDLIYTRKLRAGYEMTMAQLFGVEPLPEWTRLITSGMECVEAAMEAWKGLPMCAQPTALAIGTELSTWQGIERWLARRGRRIGYAPGDFALAGAAGNNGPLLYGEGYALRQAELVTLADVLGRQALPALLTGDTTLSPVLRILPPLQPLPSLQLPLPALQKG